MGAYYDNGGKMHWLQDNLDGWDVEVTVEDV